MGRDGVQGLKKEQAKNRCHFEWNPDVSNIKGTEVNSLCVCVFVLHEFSAGPNERAVISGGGKRAAELKRFELKAAVFL